MLVKLRSSKGVKLLARLLSATITTPKAVHVERSHWPAELEDTGT